MIKNLENVKNRRLPTILSNACCYVKVYLTTGLFIIVSWISFIVPPEVVPGNTDNLHTCITIIILSGCSPPDDHIQCSIPLTKSQLETCRSNGPAGDLVPGVGQHLQLGDWQRTKGRGAHCCRDLGNFVVLE